MRNDLENAIRRGDEFFDLYDQECNSFNQLQEAFDELADRLRERDCYVEKLTKLLIKNGVEIDED